MLLVLPSSADSVFQFLLSYMTVERTCYELRNILYLLLRGSHIFYKHIAADSACRHIFCKESNCMLIRWSLKLSRLCYCGTLNLVMELSFLMLQLNVMKCLNI